MSSAAKLTDLFGAVAELVEQRAQLEDRLADFYRVASNFGEQPLPPGASGALSDLKTAIGRFDTDLTRLANAVHAVTESVGPAAAVIQVVFVACGQQQFALRVEDVKEIRGWEPGVRANGWRDREMNVVKIEEALQLENYTAPSKRKLIVLNSPSGAALLVDDVTRQDELVLRPMSPLVPGPYVGAVSGLHGDLVLVLDSPALLASTPLR